MAGLDDASDATFCIKEAREGQCIANSGKEASQRTGAGAYAGALKVSGLSARASTYKAPSPTKDLKTWVSGLSTREAYQLTKRTAVCGPACTVVWEGKVERLFPIPINPGCVSCRKCAPGMVRILWVKVPVQAGKLKD